MRKVLAILAGFGSIGYSAYFCADTGFYYADQNFCNSSCGQTCEVLLPNNRGFSCDTSNYELFIYNPDTNKTIAVSKNLRRWTDTTNLLVVESATDNSAGKEILSYLRASAWIGLYDPDFSTGYNSIDPTRFKWYNGASLNYQNWANGEPDNRVFPEDTGFVSPLGEHWVLMNPDGTWRDYGKHKNDPDPEYRALVQWKGQLDCVSGLSQNDRTTTGDLVALYCNGQTPCWLCTDGSNMQRCSSGNVWNTGSSGWLCHIGKTACNENVECPPGGSYNPQANMCEASVSITCPPGGFYNPQTNRCEATVNDTWLPNWQETTYVTFNLRNVMWSSGTIFSLDLIIRDYGAGGNYISLDGFKKCDYYNTIYARTIRDGSVSIELGGETSIMFMCYEGWWGYSGNRKAHVYKYTVKVRDKQISLNYTYMYAEVDAYGNIARILSSAEYKGAEIPLCPQGTASTSTVPAAVEGRGGTVFLEILADGRIKLNGTPSTSTTVSSYGYATYKCKCNEGYTYLFRERAWGYIELCIADPQYSCPQGYNLTAGKCRADAKIEMVCPINSSRPCIKDGNDYFCSPYDCLNAETTPPSNNDTGQGQNDIPADGQIDANGCRGTVYVFNGRDMRCRLAGTQTGWWNCCRVKANWVGLGRCTPTEQQAVDLRDNGNCHYIGDYCAERWGTGRLSTCVQYKRTYCCFSSPLARIIHEQGRPQLGIDWGTPTSPNCRGFTAEEFQKLDFSKIDLSEWVNQEVKGKLEPKINNRISNVLNQMNSQFK